MNTSKFTKIAETEKAINFIVGFKFCENSPSIVYGIDGNENLNTGYLLNAWVPKSLIDKDGNIVEWFAKKLLIEKRFNPIMGDEIYC